MLSVEEAFRRLTIGDARLLAVLGDVERSELETYRLAAPDEALLRIAALVALDAPPSSYREAVEAGLRAGARFEDLLSVLLAVAGTVGSAKIVAAAPRIALAAGYDAEAALE